MLQWLCWGATTVVALGLQRAIGVTLAQHRNKLKIKELGYESGVPSWVWIMLRVSSGRNGAVVA